jgi:hypothetical protein
MTSTFGYGDGIDRGCYQSQGFGPATGNQSCANGRDQFDFTLQFEQGILSIGPSAIFLLAFPFRWFYLHSQSRKAKQNGLLGIYKLVSSLFQPSFLSNLAQKTDFF